MADGDSTNCRAGAWAGVLDRWSYRDAKFQINPPGQSHQRPKGGRASSASGPPTAGKGERSQEKRERSWGGQSRLVKQGRHGWKSRVLRNRIGCFALLCSGLPGASSEGPIPCFSPPAGWRLEMVRLTDREEKSPPGSFSRV